MPPTDLIPNLLDDPAPGTTPPSDSNAVNPTSGVGTGSKKKGKKGKKNAAVRAKLAEAQETYGASPPPGRDAGSGGEEGVRLGTAGGCAGESAERAGHVVSEPTPPLSEAEVEGGDDDGAAWREDGDVPIGGPERGWEEPEGLPEVHPDPSPQVSAREEDEYGGDDLGFENFAPTLRNNLPGTPEIRPTKPQPPPPAVASPTTRSPRPAYAHPAAPPPRVSAHPTRPSTSAAKPPPRPRQQSFVEPSNPPHLAQDHFYGMPALDLGFGAAKQEKGGGAGGKQAGSEHYACSFDSLAESGDGTSALRARDVLLLGEEGGLQVFRLGDVKMEVVGRLEGLRGAVVGAKILPVVGTGEGHEWEGLRPLVAVVVHGRMATETHEGFVVEDAGGKWQTTVEVLSLQKQRHVATLYKSLPVSAPETLPGALPTSPEPVGDLHLQASGHFLTLASGKSGEVFVFTDKPRSGEVEPHFRCVGKYWTSLQSRFDIPPPPDTQSNPSHEHTEPQTAPLLSLSNRWLAVVPPSSSSKISVQGILTLAEGTRVPPGVGLHSAPPPPAPSAEVLGADNPGALAKFSRQAAQELVKAGKRGMQMSRAGWREFTQPSPPGQTAHARGGSAEAGLGFPPTNAPGEDAKRGGKEPSVVALLDLERLVEAEEFGAKVLPPPLAAFAVDEGVNFLSLSSDGLRLLTTSRKGEISTVWGMAHAAHSSTSPAGDGAMVPHVTRLTTIPRNSQAVVLDAAWAKDGAYVALLTANGTAHLHDLTASPQSTRKRARRPSTAVQGPAPEKAAATVGLSAGLSPPSGNGFLGSLKSWGTSVNTTVNGLRNTTAPPNPPNTSAADPPNTTLGGGGFAFPTTFAGFRAATNAGAAAGSRYLGRGLNQGLSAAKVGVGDFWHADDNKVRVPCAASLPAPTGNAAAGAAGGVTRGDVAVSDRRISWLRRKGGGWGIGVVGRGGAVVCAVSPVHRLRGEEVWRGLKAERSGEGRRSFSLPTISTSLECGAMGVHGFWSLKNTGPAPAPALVGAGQGGFGVGEVAFETNPPFCPLYVDRRVAMLASDEDLHEVLGRGFGDDEDVWTFGGPISIGRKLNGRDASAPAASGYDDGLDDTDDEAAGDAEHEATAHSGGLAGEGRLVQSRVLVDPRSKGIRIQSSRKSGSKDKMRGRGGPKSLSGRQESKAKEDGEFELLEDDEDIF